MELLKKIVYSLNLSLYVLIAFMVGIFLKQWLLGGIIFLSSGVFIIGYKLSESMMVSRRDRYRNSEWGLLCRKLMWANNGVLMTAALLVIIVVWSGNEQIATSTLPSARSASMISVKKLENFSSAIVTPQISIALYLPIIS